MPTRRSFHAPLAAAVALALAACADPVSAPLPIVSPFSGAVSLATLGTPPTTNRDLEGEAWVCKAGSPSAQKFTFTYATRYRLSGAALPNGAGSVDVAPGECALVVKVNREVSIPGGLLIDVSEAAPPQYWALTNITTFLGIVSTFVPPVTATIDIPNRSITNQFFMHDAGTIITFTNIYTPPPPPPPPPAGCSLTQGYWKTHNNSFRGGAKADPAWQLVGPLAEGETFFLSGKTWFQVFNTPVGGNAYYNLAHQYMAAALNVLNGTSAPAEVTAALASAKTLFETYTPAQIAALRGNAAPRPLFISLAGTLGSYNEGDIGPGHCD